MKLLGKMIAGIVICLILALVVFRITGLDPIGPKKDGDNWRARNYPGLWLRGTVSTDPVPDWSFTDDMPTVMVQTHTTYGLPHSTIIACNVYQGHLYFVSDYLAAKVKNGRFWNRNVARDPRVRLKVGDKLYDRKLVEVTDPVELAGVLASRLKKYGPEHPTWFHPPRDDPPGSVVKVYRVVDN